MSSKVLLKLFDAFNLLIFFLFVTWYTMFFIYFYLKWFVFSTVDLVAYAVELH